MKVVDMRIKEEVTLLPFDKSQAENLIAYLMQYKDPGFQEMADGESIMLREVVFFLENNSGADRKEIYQKYFAKGAGK